MTRPLLKWAGGKRQLLPILRAHYPEEFARYIEPFFGSGAVFFDLHALGRLDDCEVWLADDNVDLMGCYLALRRDVEAVIDELARLERDYHRSGPAHFYEVRDGRFNPERRRVLLDSEAARYTAELAAMFIFLNRTGFNGLFRVNASGMFNVPAGRYAKPRICNPTHLREVAAALRRRGVHLVHGSFDRVLATASRGDLVYCDPPYAPLSRTASFTAYTADRFTSADQQRLQQAVLNASRRGACVILSNSAAPMVRKLYGNADARRAGLRIRRVVARRAINARASARGPVDELLITNRP